ncbi:protein tic 100 [Phtheirospermum japonicum]|uniref:Protein tic 100 n=1 Tax=Phtheirospermum japonicum TaxID=374723 RepID=A0A830DHX1_9LAMI|nr:protein tic 100 [Phtheirospermum japonicum]
MSTPTDKENELQTEQKNSDEDDSETETPPPESSSSSSDSDGDYDSGSDEDYEPVSYVRPDGTTQELDPYDSDSENTPEANISRFNRLLNSKRLRRLEEEEEEDADYHEDLFDFPKDPENWREEDVRELWADAPIEMTKPGWDPHNVDEEEVEIISEEIKAGRDPPIAPFYVPYRKYYPVIPDNHYDISNPKSVIEELDRIEEFLTWQSYIFEDGSSYEGTVWDDLAHGKGVYVAELGLVRYEGEWLQNNMEGHGIVEVDIPTMEPIPGSKLEAKMRAEGQIISRDFLPPEDREWLEMDIEDSLRLADGELEVPFYENDEWIRQFGRKPEKGRYRYAGQWKHGRMHGCGVYEVNERTIFGRFYFGELLDDPSGCDADVSALHAGIAEVAAAKARMFVNKPDGMVREDRGPYSDPQHPYLYEDEDVWMAPGFINQFYEVPDYWKMYVHEVDEEREMWLNSFYKAPLRLPMPSELEYWWAKDEKPEFVLINKDPEPDPENPTKLVYTEDPLILHTPTGRIINYVDDDEHGIRLFWQPPLKEGEDVNPDNAPFLPLGFDEFYGREETVEKKNLWWRLVTSMENACKPVFDGLEKWSEEKKKASETKMELLKKEMELVDAELSLKEAIEDLDEELKRMQKEEESKVEGEVEEEEVSVSESGKQLEKTEPEAEDEEDEGGDEEEDDDDDEDENTPSSFGSIDGQSSANDDRKRSNGKSTFAAASLSFGSSSFVSLVPPKLQNSFLRWKEGTLQKPTSSHTPTSQLPPERHSFCIVTFPRTAPAAEYTLRFCIKPFLASLNHGIAWPVTRYIQVRKEI